MATQEPSQGGLPNIGVDLTKAPLYGAGTDEYMDTIQKAQQDAIKALQDRYANPNWFKVAAGFAKPQLGGFLASLGSASEAMGETVEQERAQQMPIQVLKMQAAQTAGLMKTTKDVNDEIRKWTAQHPGEQVPSHLLQDWFGRAPDSQGVKSLVKEREDFQKKMELTNQSEALKAQQGNLAIQGNQLQLQGIQAEIRQLETDHENGLVKDSDYKKRRRDLDTRIVNLASSAGPVPKSDQPLSNQPGTSGTDILPPAMTGGAGTQTNVAPLIPAKDTSTRPMDVTNTIGPKRNPLSGKTLPANVQGQTNTTTPEQYKHVVQQPTPSGEPSSVYQGKVKSAESTAKSEEDRTNQLVNPYYLANSPRISNSYDAAIKDLRMIQKDPELQRAYAELHNLLRKKGGPLGTAAQDGLTANLGGYGASFKVPVETYLAAGVPEKYHGLYDRILGDYNTLASTHAMLDGKTLDDFNKNPSLWQRYAHIGKPADEAYRAVNDNMFDFKMHQAIGQQLPAIRARIQAQHPDELAPTTAAFRSKDVSDIVKAHDKARDIEREIHKAATQKNPRP